METKREIVKYVRTARDNQECVEQEKAEALKPFETDGWIGDASALGNPHCRRGTADRYEVHFVRWVDPTEALPTLEAQR